MTTDFLILLLDTVMQDCFEVQISPLSIRRTFRIMCEVLREQIAKRFLHSKYLTWPLYKVQKVYCKLLQGGPQVKV